MSSSDPAPETPTTSRCRDASIAVIRTLRAADHEALWAGGCVRDLVLAREPKDFDVATSATPEEVTRCFERTVLVGAAYGVVRVLIDGAEIEVATFRTDGGYTDGRRPDQVTWTTAEDDVRRRDFTINGLLADPLADGDAPEIIDYVGGLSDLTSRLVRAIGDPDARFGEDHLRILRAIRFASRLDFAIHEETWTAVVRNGESLETVSAERIRDELQGMWTEGRPAHALRLLTEAKLLDLVLPELVDAEAAMSRLERANELSPAVGWATVLLDIPNPTAALPAWGKRLRLSRAVSDRVAVIVRTVRALESYAEMRLAARKRLLRTTEAPDALAVAALAAGADQLESPSLDTARSDLDLWTRDDLYPEALITGEDLRAAGHQPGPSFGAALAAVEEAQLEGTCTSREVATAIASSVLKG